MNIFTSREFRAGIIATIVAVVIVFVWQAPFREAEKILLNTKYKVRGSLPADSSVVIVYLDNSDIDALGGLPIKRNYYALLIHALHDVGASVIGVDIAFTEPDFEHPEYDELLSSVVKLSGNVVFGGYFRSVSDQNVSQPGVQDSLLDRFVIGTKEPYPLKNGISLELPFPQLLQSVQRIGHTNFTDNNNIPFLLGAGNGKYLPAFAFVVEETRRMYNRADTQITADERLFEQGKIYASPLGDDGDVMINYPGDIRSFQLISGVNFLKEYDEMKSGGMPSAYAPAIKGKIVLVGIIAEGRSQFVETPFAQQFPSIGMHATFIDNLLQDRFLHGAMFGMHSPKSGIIIALLMGVLSTLLMMMRKEVVGLLSIVIVMALLVALSLYLFSSQASMLSVTPSLFSVIIVVITLLLTKHQSTRAELHEVSRQKETISETLSEKEQTLRKLEQELAGSLHRQSDANNIQLLDEIRRYKTEIEQMKATACDSRPFTLSSQDATVERSDFHGILYYSNGHMAKVVDFIKKIADTNAVVLVQGESGTGKELVANAIHRQSQRKEKPFVAINCGALSESLLESELFGHERGAFTGAMREKPGRFELADGGTIFLDEIGETSEAFQVKLLRVLQDGTFERVGGTETRKVDIRVVAATNRDLKQQVALKRFREDLFYRVNVFAIQLPPLRDRKDDIPLLVESFISAEQPGMTCSQSAVDALMRHEWRGNIRELQSAIKRAVVLAVSEGRQMLRLKDFSDEVIAAGLEKDNLEERIIASLREKEFSRSAISETAEDLGGLNRGTVAEYFRGYVFKVFSESHWNLEHTVESIAGVRDFTIRGRVQKKASEYLANAIQYVDASRSFDEVTTLSKPKYKNLPQRYHVYLDQLISSAYKGAWTIDLHSFNNDSQERLN